MPYQLGVDLGTTFTAAATCRQGRSEIFTLGTRALEIPSVAFLKEDGQLLLGEAAERRSLTQPGRVAREFKRRMGDPTPILLGGTPFSAHILTSNLLRWVVDEVAKRQGERAELIVVTYPANWGKYKRELLDQALSQADVGTVTTLTEPEAAAAHYAATTRVAAGEIVAVYDLGGGTFDATVLRKTEVGFDLLGDPLGIEHLGGVDFDEAVFSHVASGLGDAGFGADPDDPAMMAAVSRLRRDCVDAKEALSSDTEVTIPVALPTVRTETRLTRVEFEDLIRPALAETIRTMRRVLLSADVDGPMLKAAVLVGGSSRIPLVGQMVVDELQCPVAIDIHPKHAVAMGAAATASLLVAGTPPPSGKGPTAMITSATSAAAARSAVSPVSTATGKIEPSAPAAASIETAPAARTKAEPATLPPPPPPPPPVGRRADPVTTPPAVTPHGPPPDAPPAAEHSELASPPTPTSTGISPTSPAPPTAAVVESPVVVPLPAEGEPPTGRRRQRVLMSALGLAAAVAIVAVIVVVAAGGGDDDATSDTSAPVVTQEPVALPQGLALSENTLAYTRVENGSPNIWLIEANGSNDRPLINGNSRPSQQPVWSPDRRTIVFTVDNAGSWELWAADTNGDSSGSIATDLAPGARATWSPDGRRLAVVREQNGQRDIYVLDLDNDELTNLTDSEAEEIDPAWSPDGLRIAFSMAEGDNQDIYVLSSEGGEPTRLTDTAGADAAPTWHPAATELAFATQRDGDWNIYAMDPDGGDARAVTTDPSDDQFPSWSPDGTSIAFQAASATPEQPDGSQIATVAAEGGVVGPVTSGGGPNVYAAWGWRAIADGVMTAEVLVESQVLWTDTGLILLEGDQVEITSEGEFADDRTRPEQVYEPDGIPRDPDDDIHFRDLWLDLPHGALIGQIDDGEAFLVGRTFDSDSLPAGKLFLGMNDGYAEDNTGSFTAEIEVRRFAS